MPKMRLKTVFMIKERTSTNSLITKTKCKSEGWKSRNYTNRYNKIFNTRLKFTEIPRFKDNVQCKNKTSWTEI